MRLFYILVSLSLIGSGQAAEVDQFTPSAQPLADSADVLNLAVNAAIAESLAMANRPRPVPPKMRHRFPAKGPGCNVRRLYYSLSWNLARPVIGQIESFAEQEPAVSRRQIPFSQSVYQDFRWPESPSLVLSERVAAVIRIGDVELGTDKLGHFFTEGFSYFEITDYLTSGTEQGLLFGEWSESVYFGAQTTGVFSYADLVANFNGLRFWNRILAEQPDPLSGNQPPAYISCEDNRWQQADEFRWQDYVDAAWDESRNCSLYRNPELLSRVLNHAPACTPHTLPQSRYGHYSHRLLNDAGPAVLPSYLQPEVILAQRRLSDRWQLPAGIFERIRDLRQRFEAWRDAKANAMESPAI